MDSAEVFDRARAGDQVRRLLDEAELGTQAELARHLGLAAASVNRWAKRNGNPDPRYWDGIERFFELRAGTLRAIALGADGDTDREVLASLLEDAIRAFGDQASESIRLSVADAVQELRRGDDTGPD